MLIMGLPLASPGEGSLEFFLVMAVANAVGICAASIAAYRARRDRRSVKYRRYIFGVWGFSAWELLVFAHILLRLRGQ